MTLQEIVDRSRRIVFFGGAGVSTESGIPDFRSQDGLYDAQFILRSSGIPRCACGGVVKPDVVLYEEPLDEATARGAMRVISEADALIVAGTSLNVYPAAGYLSYFRGRDLVVINRDATPADADAALVIREPVGQVLGELRV